MSTIFLIRHGETTWNRAGRLQGQMDSPLTLLGVRQAEAIGRALRGHIAERAYEIVASPLGRARQTAAIIADMLGHDYDAIHFDDRLKEISLGDRDGYHGWRALARDFPEDEQRRAADPWHYQHPNGESSQLVQDRVRPFLAERRARDHASIVVAHGVVNKILRGLHLDLTPEQTYALDRPQDVIHELRDGTIAEHRVKIRVAAERA